MVIVLRKRLVGFLVERLGLDAKVELATKKILERFVRNDM